MLDDGFITASSSGSEEEQAQEEQAHEREDMRDAAYIIYTSGTTGVRSARISQKAETTITAIPRTFPLLYAWDPRGQAGHAPVSPRF